MKSKSKNQIVTYYEELGPLSMLHMLGRAYVNELESFRNKVRVSGIDIKQLAVLDKQRRAFEESWKKNMLWIETVLTEKNNECANTEANSE